MPDSGSHPPAGRQRLGGYELIRKLGEGGMGATYLARQISMDRLVALKVLKKALARKAGFVERFVREARLAGRLSHANIVQALDVGEAGGFHYLAMDYVEGQPASRLIPSGGALPEERALDIARQVARALECAGRQGIVHRDVKPDNILVAADGTAKLCDFGLAREAAGDSGLTQEGAALGTPYYIAPEQARGEGGVDVRADIYSLGATLYHFVTGRTPFEGPTAAVVMTKHIHDEAPWPQDVNPAVSDGCARLIERMMAREPEDRYRTPGELIADIERVLDGQQPAAKPLAPGRSAVVRGGGAETAAGARRSARPRTGQWTTRTRPVAPVCAGGRRPALPMLIGAGALAVLVLATVGVLILRGGGDGGDDARRAAAQAEAAAQSAWASGVAPLGGGPLTPETAGRLLSALAEFEGRHGPTEFARGRAGELARLREAAGAALRAPDPGKVLEEQLTFAEEWWKSNPASYAEAARRFGDVAAAAEKAGQKVTLWKAEDLRREVEKARAAAAEAAAGPLLAEAGKLAAAGDYDGALKLLAAPPEAFAELLGGRFGGECDRLAQEAEGRVGEVLAAAEKFSADGEPDKGLAELDRLAALKYAALAGKVGALRERLQEERKNVAALTEKKLRVEAARRLGEILDGFDRRCLAGGYPEAGEFVKAERGKLPAETLKLMPAGLAEAEAVAGAVTAHQAQRSAALAGLKGQPARLSLKGGGQFEGEVVEVQTDALVLKVRFKLGDTWGESQRTLKFADLAAGEMERLVPAFRPEGPDGQVAAALLAMGRGDLDAAGRALAAAGDHALAGRYRAKLDVLRLGAESAAAKDAWEKSVLPLLREKYAVAEARKTSAALAEFAAAHGATKFAQGQKPEIDRHQAAVQAALAAVVPALEELTAADLQKFVAGKVVRYDPKSYQAEILWDFSSDRQMADFPSPHVSPRHAIGAKGGMRIEARWGADVILQYFEEDGLKVNFKYSWDKPPGDQKGRPRMALVFGYEPGGEPHGQVLLSLEANEVSLTRRAARGDPEVLAARPVAVPTSGTAVVEVSGGRIRLSIDGRGAFDEAMPAPAGGCFGLTGSGLIYRLSELTVSGRVSRRWLEHRLDRARSPWRAEWKCLTPKGEDLAWLGYGLTAFDTKRGQYLSFKPDFEVWACDVRNLSWEKLCEPVKGDGKTWPKHLSPDGTLFGACDPKRDRVWFTLGTEWSRPGELFFDLAGRRWGGRYNPEGKEPVIWPFVAPELDLMVGIPRDMRAVRRHDWAAGSWAEGPVRGEVPKPRNLNFSPAFWDARRRQFVVFGGGPEWVKTTALVTPADLWAYSPEKNAWTELAFKGPSPGPRKYHAMACDSGNDLYVVFGGVRGDWRLTDTWVFDPAAGRWWELTPEVSPRTGGGYGGGTSTVGLQYDPAGRQCLGLNRASTPSLQGVGLWSLKIGRTGAPEAAPPAGK